MKHNRAIFLPVLLAFALPLGAEPGFTASTDLTLQISSRPEAKLGLTQSFIFPVLRGTGPLTEGNNLTTALTAEISPISLNGSAGAVWTPIAFFQLTAGGSAGSGWNMALGNGMGRNMPIGSYSPGMPRKAEITGPAFDGMVWGLYGGAVLQFDLAAIFPGDWNHLVVRTYHEGRYRAYTAASAGESWIFENDNGENQNGFTYYGNFLLGYQMPASPVLSMVGLLAEMDHYLYNTEGGEAWGEDLPRLYFGAVFNFAITPRIGAALLIQTRTLRNYGSGDLENKDHLYYQDLTLQRGDSYRLVFYRAALVMTFKLR